MRAFLFSDVDIVIMQSYDCHTEMNNALEGSAMNDLNWPSSVIVREGTVFFPAGMYIVPISIAPYKGAYARTGKGERKRNRKNRWR